MHTHASDDGATKPEEHGGIPSSLTMKKDQPTADTETGQPHSESNQGKESLPGRDTMGEAAPLKKPKTEGKPPPKTEWSTPPQSEPRTKEDTSPDSAASKRLIFKFRGSHTIECQVPYPVQHLGKVWSQATSQRPNESRPQIMLMDADDDKAIHNFVASECLVNGYLDTHDVLKINVTEVYFSARSDSGIEHRSLPLSWMPGLREGSHIEVSKKDVSQLLLNCLGLEGITQPDVNSIVFKILEPSNHG
jgi:hypothetical protein